MNHSKELQEKINLAEYGKAMRAARMKAGYTLMRLTEESGIGENGICKYEAGQTNPTVRSLIAICDVLKISIDDYIGRKIP